MKLKSDLTRLAMEVPELTSQVLKQTGDDIANLASQLAPVDTGQLRDSYRSEQISETEVQIGSDVEYSKYVEMGTVNSAAQPHLTPAFHQNEETFKARMKEAIENAAK